MLLEMRRRQWLLIDELEDGGLLWFNGYFGLLWFNGYFCLFRCSEDEVLWLKLDWICDHLYQKTSVFG
jgi:hypothetical protein